MVEYTALVLRPSSRGQAHGEEWTDSFTSGVKGGDHLVDNTAANTVVAVADSEEEEEGTLTEPEYGGREDAEDNDSKEYEEDGVRSEEDVDGATLDDGEEDLDVGMGDYNGEGGSSILSDEEDDDDDDDDDSNDADQEWEGPQLRTRVSFG